MKPELAPMDAVSLSTARDRLAATGRTQILDILTPDYAQHLHTLAQTTRYDTVTLETGDLAPPSPEALARLSPEQRRLLLEALKDATRRRVRHYVFDNHPIFNGRVWAGDPAWRELVEFINGDGFLALMRDITGESRLAFADGQLTRYRQGHYLTTHNDHDEGKNRYFAYVLSLSRDWSIDWGGLLAFHGEDGNVAEAYTPRFNTLNLLKVPALHSVSMVTPLAQQDRISVTGWLRGRD